MSKPGRDEFYRRRYRKMWLLMAIGFVPLLVAGLCNQLGGLQPGTPLLGFCVLWLVVCGGIAALLNPAP